MNALRTEGYVQAAPLGMDALTTEGYEGKQQVRTLEQQRLTAGLAGSRRDGFEAF